MKGLQQALSSPGVRHTRTRKCDYLVIPVFTTPASSRLAVPGVCECLLQIEVGRSRQKHYFKEKEFLEVVFSCLPGFKFQALHLPHSPEGFSVCCPTLSLEGWGDKPFVMKQANCSPQIAKNTHPLGTL